MESAPKWWCGARSVAVNGSARGIGVVASVLRHVQSGYLYHYAFAMIIGLSALLAWLLTR